MERVNRADRVIEAIDRVLDSAAPATDDELAMASPENQVRNWQETAAQFSRDADYWRTRCEAAEARSEGHPHA